MNKEESLKWPIQGHGWRKSVTTWCILQLGQCQAQDLKVPGSVPGFGTRQKSQGCGTKNLLVVKQVLGHALEQGTKHPKAQCSCRGLVSHVHCFNKHEFPVWSQYSFSYFLPFFLNLNDTPHTCVKRNLSIVSCTTYSETLCPIFWHSTPHFCLITTENQFRRSQKSICFQFIQCLCLLTQTSL